MGKGAGIKRPTSRDVARLAGVSHTTVSFVVNEVPTASIPAETRERVHRAIAQLDYHPNEAARRLSRQATHDLALVIPETLNPHYMVIAGGLESYAESRGYNVFILATAFDVARERRGLRWLKQGRIDGLILCSTGGTDWHEEAGQLIADGQAITMIGGYVRDTEVDWVDAVVGLGECRLLEYLVALGHRRIGYIYGVFNPAIHGGRLETLLSAQHEIGLPVVAEWVRVCGPTPDDGYRATLDLLASSTAEGRPTALIAVNDLLAVAVLSALHMSGIVVPDAMSVVGFDNTPQAIYSSPPLTTVDPDARAIGEHAGRLTIARLADPRRPPARVQTEPRLVVRGSTGPAPRAI